MDSLPTAERLQTSRLILDPLRAEDADELFLVLNDLSLHEFTGGAPLSLDDLRARYRQLESQRSPDGAEAWLNWTIRLLETQEPIGTVQAGVTRNGVATVSWVTGVSWQRLGYATEAARALVEWLTTQRVSEIRAFIHPRHEASSRVARSAGLQATSELVDGEVVWKRMVS